VLPQTARELAAEAERAVAEDIDDPMYGWDGDDFATDAIAA
jgi:hypothetical protein